MSIEQKKRGRPRKAEVVKFTPISIPASCKSEIEELRHQLTASLGFEVSVPDCIRYLIKHHRDCGAMK